MGWLALIIMTVCDFWVTIDLLYKDEYPMALVFFAYGIATLGLLWHIYMEQV